jgi:molybdopterin/thiamine biosynthesis adenylyltransferase/rhodanese-related sulfurtransferase
MATYRDLLKQVKTEVDEVDPPRAAALLDTAEAPTLIDVRERDEWEEGKIPGAIHVPRGNLESRIEAAVADRDTPILLYCAAGSRSAFAAKTLGELGYTNVTSLAGGYTEWKRAGFPWELPRSLDAAKRARYSRHLLIPEVGEEGQLKLLDSRVLMLGAGGLGSPAALYLAAAGVGTIGIVDPDIVDDSNLQRQVIHSTERLGEPKVLSAKKTLEALNPDVTVVAYQERLDSDSIDRILADRWDVIVDGADNFPTRYLVNDASVWNGIPVVHGSIFRFHGQVTVFKADEGPCYRCLFPQPPPPELAPSCAEGGVLGVLPGIIGTLQANEVLKLLLGIGDPLIGRSLLFEALEGSFTEIKLRKDPACPVCGEEPTITDYIDYVEFCLGGAGHQNGAHPEPARAEVTS